MGSPLAPLESSNFILMCQLSCVEQGLSLVVLSRAEVTPRDSEFVNVLIGWAKKAFICWERGSPEPLFLRIVVSHERLWRAALPADRHERKTHAIIRMTEMSVAGILHVSSV